MRRSKRLNVVVEMSQRAEDAAATVLAQRRQELETEKVRLQDLEAYYKEYENRFASGSAPQRANTLAKNREFLSQLKESCDIQKHQIAHVQNNFDEAVVSWQRAHLKHENLCSYVEKVKTQEDATLEKQEQKRVDEWVSQQFGRKSADRS